jgi:hypothetical protein
MPVEGAGTVSGLGYDVRGRQLPRARGTIRIWPAAVRSFSTRGGTTGVVGSRQDEQPSASHKSSGQQPRSWTITRAAYPADMHSPTKGEGMNAGMQH